MNHFGNPIHFAESGAVDLMEEHFRKSLGEDYKKVFKESEKKQEPEKMEVDPVKAFKDDLDMSGYTGTFATFLKYFPCLMSNIFQLRTILPKHLVILG